jgi:hypothetical protein
MWSSVFFILPVLVTSFSFLIQSYKDWADALFYKTQKNIRLDIQTSFKIFL